MSTAAAEVTKTAVEKKPKTAMKKKPVASKTSNRLSYFEMIKEALLGLKVRSGSSPYAIAKFMEEKHKAVLPANFRKILGLQLKNSDAKGKLLKIKASYKLSEAGKKAVAVKKLATNAKKPAANAKAAKKIVVRGKAEKAEPKVVKKKVSKAAAAKKRPAPIAKAKKAKSIKSSAAKKTEKATAKA